MPRIGPRRAARGLALIAAATALARAVAAQAPVAPSPVSRGYESLQRQRLATADSFFHVAAAGGTPELRRGGLEGAALVAWRYHEDFAAAERLLARAAAEGVDSGATLVALARLRMAEGDDAAATRLALDAAGRLTTERRTELTRRALRVAATAAVEPTLVERIDGGEVDPARRPSRDTVGLAAQRLAAVVRAAPGRADDSYALLLAALAVDDGLTALEAWRSYFAIGLAPRPAALDAAGRTLAELLPTWNGARASERSRERVVGALADSRLYIAAAIVAAAPGAPRPAGRAADVVAYAGFLRALGRAADEYYRETLLGRATPADLTRSYARLTRALWPRLAWPGAPPTYFPAGADQELARRFAALPHFGVSAGYFDLHYGHRIAERRRTIVQYGHRATVHQVVIDGIASDGLQSWAWDARGFHAGWQSGDAIVQVRPALAENPIAMWEIVADSATIATTTAQLAVDSAADWTRVAGRDVAYVPGTAFRLMRDGARALFDSLRGAGLAGDTLRATFVQLADEAIREASIFAHEGRHAIDRALGVTDDAELEYRAKLSEIAFAPRPKLVLGGIVHASIGDDTPHGRANARVLRGVIAWMVRHRQAIAGLDTTRALLPQLPLLSDGQLRAAFRSLDPLAGAR